MVYIMGAGVSSGKRILKSGKDKGEKKVPIVANNDYNAVQTTQKPDNIAYRH